MRIKATTKTRKKATNEITHFFFGFFFMADTIRAIREMTPPNIPNRPNTAYIQALLSVALVPPLVSHESREVSMMGGGGLFCFSGNFEKGAFSFLGQFGPLTPAPAASPYPPQGGPAALPSWRRRYLIQRARQERSSLKKAWKNLQRGTWGTSGHMINCNVPTLNPLRPNASGVLWGTWALIYKIKNNIIEYNIYRIKSAFHVPMCPEPGYKGSIMGRVLINS